MTLCHQNRLFGEYHPIPLEMRYVFSNTLLFQRQRSISLSSLDSELDLELDNKPHPAGTGVGSKASRAQASTHSLNEADLIQVVTHFGEK